MGTIKKQIDAVAFLRDRGFKASKSQFNRDVAARKISKTDAGFDENALMAYAVAHLQPVAQHESKALTSATTERLAADTDLKRYSAERQRLKLEKEKGLLMPRAEYEEALAARALFFKSEIESFGYRKAGEIIALVEGDQARLDQFLEFWQRETADWLDAYSIEREFAVEDDKDTAGGGVEEA